MVLLCRCFCRADSFAFKPSRSCCLTSYVPVCRNPKKKFTISYPCVMLNVDVFINNTNPQYQVSLR